MAAVPFSPFPLLHSDRLRLRRPHLSDAPRLFALRSHPQVNLFLDRSPPADLAAVEQWILRLFQGESYGDWVYWILEGKESGEMIGTACLWNFNWRKKMGEIGFECFPAVQGRGYMTEAGQQIVSYALGKLELERLEGFTHPENRASQRLLRRLGFQLREHLPPEKGGLAIYEVTSESLKPLNFPDN